MPDRRHAWRAVPRRVVQLLAANDDVIRALPCDSSMKTLAVMNEKGGVGKTTLVAHAGWFFAERHRTLVIDLDQQANLTATLGAHVAALDSVELFAQVSRVPRVGALSVALSTRDLLGVEGVDRSCIETFRDSVAGMADDFDICVIDTPPSLTNRTFGALLAADAVLAPIGIHDYSIQGVAELLRAIKGVSSYYGRVEPLFLGLLAYTTGIEEVEAAELRIVRID